VGHGTLAPAPCGHKPLTAFVAQFTDPTSYRALFYFLVIKPAITLILTVLLLLLLPVRLSVFFRSVFPVEKGLSQVCAVLIFPLPALMRVVRRVGIWQAGVAVEGLCSGAA
jgi:hypothetical protein